MHFQVRNGLMMMMKDCDFLEHTKYGKGKKNPILRLCIIDPRESQDPTYTPFPPRQFRIGSVSNLKPVLGISTAKAPALGQENRSESSTDTLLV